MIGKIQSILIDKSVASLDDAIKWIKQNDYILNKVHITNNYYRFRQLSPQNLLKQGFTNIRTHDFKNGIKFIIYY